jgi:predicted small metal-binding protein
MTDDVTYANRCACGWEIQGGLDEVVDATIDHGRRIHNMEATRDDVLAAVNGDAAPDTAEMTPDPVDGQVYGG